jgi:hypothetical protein
MFEWTAIEGARSYRVTVVNSDGVVVAETGEVQGLRWAANVEFPPGEYGWQVAAMVEGGEILMPLPPLPEARFRVK